MMSERLRVLTWNMAHARPGRFRSAAVQRRQWAWIDSLAPDIALLQECDVHGFSISAPPWMDIEYQLSHQFAAGQRTGAAVLARRSLGFEALDRAAVPDPQRRWLEYMAGYLHAGTVTVAEQRVFIASVYANAREVPDGPPVSDSDHEMIKRPSRHRAWFCDLAAAALDGAVIAPFVIGGDWNQARLFDATTPSKSPGSREFFDSRRDAGWFDLLRKFSDTEVRTFLAGKAPYELDHIFVDQGTYGAATQTQVLSELPVPELSDHAAVLAEFR